MKAEEEEEEEDSSDLLTDPMCAHVCNDISDETNSALVECVTAT